jgi:hypothetical protein
VTLRQFGLGDGVLVAASMVAVIVLTAAYLGRTTRSIQTRSERGIPIVNLNTVADSAALEPGLAPAFAAPADRRLAARELFGFLAQADGGRRVLRNVGAIARAEVPVTAIEGDSRLARYSDRLRAARDRAAASGTPPPQTLSLLTPAELAEVKPSFVVREGGAVRRGVLVWCVC